MEIGSKTSRTSKRDLNKEGREKKRPEALRHLEDPNK
ncbi:hypothetical protein LEMLEM_LOCUS5011 [Lemmus lemmus]